VAIDKGRPEICNVFTMHRTLDSEAACSDIEHDCRSGALGCGDGKMRLRDVMVAELGPVRERGAALRREPRRMLDVLHEGAARARTLAEVTLGDVRRAMGITPSEAA
jgi:tryptophanyl-tRNA synthetase